MASTSEESAKSKRKVDAPAESEEETKKKSKKKTNNQTGDPLRIVKLLTEQETKQIQLWERIVADLGKAGIDISERNVHDSQRIMWKWGEDKDKPICVALDASLVRIEDTKEWVPEYRVRWRWLDVDKSETFEANEWDAMVEHLGTAINGARNASAGAQIIGYLESETSAWKVLLEIVRKAKGVPYFSDYEIDDGLITLEWDYTDKGFRVYLMRSTEDLGDGDVHASFWVKKMPCDQNDESIKPFSQSYDNLGSAINCLVQILN